MSYKEALRDGVPVKKGHDGFNWYYPRCHICGIAVPSWRYDAGTVYTCKECRQELLKLEHQEKLKQQLPAKQRKLKNAISRISKVADISAYDGAISIVKKKLEKPGWFQSTEEIMTALELVKCGVTAHHQVKIFDYRVDFLLPELQVVLEIDGKPFHGKERQPKQDIRDEVIVNKLGEGWQVIHIAAENINKNVTKLIPAIHAVLRHRRKKGA